MTEEFHLGQTTFNYNIRNVCGCGWFHRGRVQTMELTSHQPSKISIHSDRDKIRMVNKPDDE